MRTKRKQVTLTILKNSDESTDGKQSNKSGEVKQLTVDSDNANGQEKRGAGDSSASSA